ncbi:MAG: ABC transporter permease [Lachnospirales bacterium]
MDKIFNGFFRILCILVVSLLIGSIFILMIGENPIDAYIALIQGAFVGKRNFGNTIALFTPLMLTSLAFAVAARAGAFNVGVEGSVFLGALGASIVGIYGDFLPTAVHLVACFLVAIIIGGLWALIPAVLKAYYKVNEVCSTILLNYVAIFITSYVVSVPISAGTSIPQSLPISEDILLTKFMRPSNANIGVFIAIAVVIVVIIVYNNSTFGFKMKAIGVNPDNAKYVGIDPKKNFIKAMVLSGVLGGIAGCIEVLGVYGYFLSGFGTNLGFNGMLASLIAKNNLFGAPFMAFFIGALKSGALGLQQATGVPRAIVDTITATFIIIATMDTLFQFNKEKIKTLFKKNKKTEVI